MKTLTPEQIEKNKAERLDKNDKKGLIRRNTWGIEKPLESKPYALPSDKYPASDNIDPMELAEKTVQRAAQRIKYIQKAIKELDRMLGALEPEQIVMICKEVGIDAEFSDMLSDKEISEKFKWEIIYNMDKAV